MQGQDTIPVSPDTAIITHETQVGGEDATSGP